MPPAPESMSPRVSTFCTSVSLIRMGIDNLFELITAVVTEYISSEGDSGVDPDLLIKNPPSQHRQRTLPCLHHSFRLIGFEHEQLIPFLSSFEVGCSLVVHLSSSSLGSLVPDVQSFGK